MKKLTALLLALVMVMSLAACGAKKEEAPKQEETKTEAPKQEETKTEAPKEEAAPTDGEVAQPDGYPSKNIAWIAPAAAGAAIDLPTRVAADLLQLGKPVVVENIAGASQTLGTAEFAARPADGYTLLTMANACGIAQPLMNEVAYDLADFRYIAMLAPTVPATICVRDDSEIETPEQLIELMTGGEFIYGITNAGGYGHMAICKVMNDLGCYDNGIQMVYNGSMDNIAAIMNGEVDFAVVDTTDAVKTEGIRVITVLDKTECALFPDAPLMADYGVSDLDVFVGVKYVAMLKDTPTEIVDWVKQELNKVLQSQEYQDYMIQMGFGPLREYTEEELHAFMEKAADDYGEVMRSVGLIQ